VGSGVATCATPLGGSVKRQDYKSIDAAAAAERLGISEAEIERLIERGEVPAVQVMGDPRWLILITDVERMARQAKRRDARPRQSMRAKAATLVVTWSPLWAMVEAYHQRRGS
jgi:excisionase family DNA binding protein